MYTQADGAYLKKHVEWHVHHLGKRASGPPPFALALRDRVGSRGTRTVATAFAGALFGWLLGYWGGTRACERH